MGAGIGATCGHQPRPLTRHNLECAPDLAFDGAAAGLRLPAVKAAAVVLEGQLVDHGLQPSVHELDQHHRRTVAVPRTFTDDAGIAARTLLEARHEIAEESLRDLAIQNVPAHLAAG